MGLALSFAIACGGDKKKPSGSDGDTSTDSGGSMATSVGGGAGESGQTTNGGTGGDGGSTGGSGGSDAGGTGGAPGGAGGEASIAWGEAGFIDIEGVSVGNVIDSIGDDPVTAPTKLFYSYVPAENADAPLFVFVGSDVGLSTLGTFASFGVGPATLDAEDPSAAPTANEFSWLEMGSLLFIDPRQTGFSYSQIADPELDENRVDEYLFLNFNAYVDAADMVRALLRFLAEHGEQQDNPIVLVAQGSAGTRTALMLSYLLYPDELRDAEGDYVDEALADEVDAHFASVFPGDDVDASVASQQFGWQVHVQPHVGGNQAIYDDAYYCLDGSPEVDVAEEAGVVCPPSATVRESWYVPAEPGWRRELLGAARTTLTSIDGFEALLGLAADDVSGLAATDRGDAFRWDGRPAIQSSPEVEDGLPVVGEGWTAELGELELYDRYFIVENPMVEVANYQLNSPRYCTRFLRSLMHVESFVTNAALDMAVKTPAIVDTLENCAADLAENPLDSIDVDFEVDDVARPGWLVVSFNDLAEIGAATRTVRWPEYQASGHAVHWNEPEALRDDVRAFLSDTGLDL